MHALLKATLLFLLTVATACASSRRSPFHESNSGVAWSPIRTTDVTDATTRRVLYDLLRVTAQDVLWPRFTLDDHAILLVSEDRTYCVGRCVPLDGIDRGASRLWARAADPSTEKPDTYRFASPDAWALQGTGQLVTVAVGTYEQTMATALHEDFHVQYQTEYSLQHGDGPAEDPPSGATRRELEESYSRAPAITNALREECTALVDALNTSNRRRAMASIVHFVAVRERRRSLAGTPSFEEDFWERLEGIPTNIERRAASTLGFDDPSVIAWAIERNGCAAIPEASYVLLLGALQAAILDRFIGPEVWPYRTHPVDGSDARTLYSLVRELVQSTKRGGAR